MNTFRRFKRAVGISYYTAISIPGAWRKDPDAAYYARRWFASLLPGRSPLGDAVPWLSFRAVEWLEGHLTRDMRVFEYGSGGSTLFLARRAREVVSVEHDRVWHGLVAAELARQGIDNCTYCLVEPVLINGAQSASAQEYGSNHANYQGMTFAAYVTAIDQYADATFDMILIDGRARLACARAAIAKVRPGGYIVFDNMEREEYQSVRGFYAGLPSVDVSGVLPYGRPHWSMTTVWSKPG